MLLDTEYIDNIIEAAKACALALRAANDAFETDEDYLTLEENHPEYCKVIDSVIDLEDVLKESQASLYSTDEETADCLKQLDEILGKVEA
tara:strand:+ start:680 stop:949 length:270 start_codon:yes stop_codon:yes gene_type:complete